MPAWATPVGQLHQVDWDVWFANNAYAEWYMNTWRIDGSPGQLHHYQTYGEEFEYMDFVPMFNDALAEWNPDEMVQLFADVNARYVVLTTKHHDGFTLWPSSTKNPNRPDDQQGTTRDVVGELGAAVRSKGMRMGYYYSGGLDWSFNPKPIVKREDVAGTVIHDDEYARTTRTRTGASSSTVMSRTSSGTTSAIPSRETWRTSSRITTTAFPTE